MRLQKLCWINLIRSKIMASVYYNEIGDGLTVQVKMDELPMRDKINLYLKLSQQLGISERLEENAQQIIMEQINLYWK